MKKDRLKPVYSVQLTFEKGSDEVHVRIRPGSARDFYGKLSEDLTVKLDGLLWKKEKDKIISRYTRVGEMKYLEAGILASERLNQGLEEILHDLCRIIKVKDREYTES